MFTQYENEALWRYSTHANVPTFVLDSHSTRSEINHGLLPKYLCMKCMHKIASLIFILCIDVLC